MTAGVYLIWNTVTDRAYVGSSVDIERRWVAHRRSLRRGGGAQNRGMRSDLRRHGLDSFAIEILEVVDGDGVALEAAEQRWLDHERASRRAGVYNRDRPVVRRDGMRTGYRVRESELERFIADRERAADDDDDDDDEEA